ncbi:hypothetical protein HID58_066635 [Brassica napus]|uniref:Uncharacterized protein n=1 Tax=Brassica napus TaxID=3708 RepID=A0ABQ7ZG95_BRANA|nr:hypothetical protein HID58_066635 [Brassica napus]
MKGVRFLLAFVVFLSLSSFSLWRPFLSFYFSGKSILLYRSQTLILSSSPCLISWVLSQFRDFDVLIWEFRFLQFRGPVIALTVDWSCEECCLSTVFGLVMRYLRREQLSLRLLAFFLSQPINGVFADHCVSVDTSYVEEEPLLPFYTLSEEYFVESHLRKSLNSNESFLNSSEVPRLAYLISGTKGDSHRMMRTLQAVYHPRNQYVLHLDLEAPPKERLELAMSVKSDPTFREVTNVRPTMIACTLQAVAVLLKESLDWDWFINLSASDY